METTSNGEAHKYLVFSIKGMKFINMWATDKKGFFPFVKKYLVLVGAIITMACILADCILQFYEEKLNFSPINEDLIGVTSLLGATYVSICYMKKGKEVNILLEDITIFEKFCPKDIMEDTEIKVTFYTKSLLFYGVAGSLIYASMPLLNYSQCIKTRSEYMVQYGLPCGVMARFLLPFKHDYTPFFELIALEQTAISLLCALLLMTLTMMIFGLVMHICANMKHLCYLILKLHESADTDQLKANLKFCLDYHATILRYSERVNKTFSLMMLLHITWTSVIISVLGFELLISDNYFDTLRYIMHLLGWLFMLFLICYSGQNLIDQSKEIGGAMYAAQWYKFDVKVRSDIAFLIFRAQKPQSIIAAGLKVMSLETFIGVMYSAYSYFMLLWKIKP